MLAIFLYFLFLISCFPNIMLSDLNYSNRDNNLRINKNFNIKVNFPSLKISGFEYISPLFIGSLSGGVVLIIIIVVIYCYCKTDDVSTKQILKIELVNSLNFSNIDKSKGNSKSNDLDDKSERNLIGTPIQKHEQKISKLFRNLTVKLNDQYHSEHDKNEFYKPVKKCEQDAASEISIVLKITPDQTSMQNKENVLICYTNERRDSPPESFYEKNLNEIKEEENEIVSKYKEKEINVEEKKEIITKDVKNNLQPGAEDIISDYKEKTKNSKFELFKQDTQDFEKESLDKFNKDLSLKKSQEDSGIIFKISTKIK